MPFAWNGEFSWLCLNCERDGTVQTRTQMELSAKVRDDHSDGVVEMIRAGRMKTACRGDKVTIFLVIDLETRRVEGQRSRPSFAKLHKRMQYETRVAAACRAKSDNFRLTDDDGAVTCRNCLRRMDEKRQYAEMMAQEEAV